MIHKVGDAEYVVSNQGVWLPGVYASEKAAEFACKFSYEELRILQNEVNDREPDFERRVISFEMLQSLVAPWKQEEG